MLNRTSLEVAAAAPAAGSIALEHNHPERDEKSELEAQRGDDESIEQAIGVTKIEALCEFLFLISVFNNRPRVRKGMEALDAVVVSSRLPRSK